MREVSIHDIEDGMILHRGVYTPEGESLALVDVRISNKHKDVFASKGITHIVVKTEEELTAYDKLVDVEKRRVDATIAALFHFNKSNHHVFLRHLLKLRREELANTMIKRRS
jgi:hypothetical protein